MPDYTTTISIDGHSITLAELVDARERLIEYGAIEDETISEDGSRVYFTYGFSSDDLWEARDLLNDVESNLMDIVHQTDIEIGKPAEIGEEILEEVAQPDIAIAESENE